MGQPIKLGPVEIRKVKIHTRLSEETLCFSCDIYLDDKRVGEATNRGHGGCTDVHVSREVLVRLDQLGEELLPDGVRWTHGNNIGKLVDGGAAQLVDHLVEQEDQRKRDEREAKKIAKADALEIARNNQRNMGTIRWQVDYGHMRETRWCGYAKGTDPALAATALSEKYVKGGGGKVTWEKLA